MHRVLFIAHGHSGLANWRNEMLEIDSLVRLTAFWTWGLAGGVSATLIICMNRILRI